MPEFEEYDTAETRKERVADRERLLGPRMEARGVVSRTRKATRSASPAPWAARDRGAIADQQHTDCRLPRPTEEDRVVLFEHNEHVVQSGGHTHKPPSLPEWSPVQKVL